MQRATKDKLSELRQIISRMPLEVFYTTALPEFGVSWTELSKAVRNARLPMQPACIARVLCKYLSKALSAEELEDIVARMRLKLVATQHRTWHVIHLSEKAVDEPVTMMMRSLPARITAALRKSLKSKMSMRPEVQTIFLGDLMFVSIQLVSEQKEGTTLFLATPPGEPVALVSSVTGVVMLKAAVEGLGYKNYENAHLYGPDIQSLLRINNRAWNANAEHLAGIPEYDPKPVITATGIDFTHKSYDENYVDSIIGPNPPVITDLNIKTSKSFFDRSRLNKTINLTLSLKTEDLAKSLKCWVIDGAIAPNSDFIQIFHKIKSNNVNNYSRSDSDED